MTITLKIKGMTCEHCKMHVEQALLGVPGVNRAEASLFWKKATVEASGDIPDSALRDAVSDAGYEVTEIKRK